ncbi:MAG: DNA gyrase inhibitor YacG [Magnetovibrio sp.]|nr:DNA gyrase inhibitor YacG [Magnetovibrio sp.]
MNDDNVVELKTLKKAGKKAKKCLMCAKPCEEKYKPFCSKRCADLDLGKWLGDGYRIPTDEVGGFPGGFGEDD